MSKPIDEILVPKPNSRPRIYAYSIADGAHDGLLKVGQTTRGIKQRIAEQTRTAGVKVKIELDEAAERDDGSVFRDHEVRAALIAKKHENVIEVGREWMRCTVNDLKTVLTELRAGVKVTGTHHERFPMRKEQEEAVRLTLDYYRSRWN